MKNKHLIASNIEQAKAELEAILADLAKDDAYSEVKLKIALEHAYHHLNFAWHIRDVDQERAVQCSPDDFAEWSKYPVGEILEYE